MVILYILIQAIFFQLIQGQSVNFINYGGKIPSEGSFDVYFEYSINVQSNCNVSLINGAKKYVSSTVTLNTGLNQNKAITLNNTGTIPIGTGYSLIIQCITYNVQSTIFSKSVIVSPGRQGFYVSNGRIYDANKNEFIMRGINVGPIWFDGWNRWWSLNSTDNIAMTKSNVVRIAWNMDLSKTGGLLQSDLEKYIIRAIQYKLVPMIVIMDSTAPSSCNSDSSCLMKMGQWWASQVSLLIKYKQSILVNIANEWAGTGYTMWRDSYYPVITTIRNAGFSGALIIDSCCNQDPNGPILYGNQLLQNDPFQNLIFSVHMYGAWSIEKGKFDIAANLASYYLNKLPFIIGEFAMQKPMKFADNSCTMVHIDALTLLKLCSQYGFGYLGWQWADDPKSLCGNSNLSTSLAIGAGDRPANFEAVNNFTPWGNFLINTPIYGIKDSSQLATIFN